MSLRAVPGGCGLWSGSAPRRGGWSCCARSGRCYAASRGGSPSMAEQTGAAWASAAADAECWSSRACALGGSTAVRLAAGDVAGQGTVSISWRSTMGTRHPDEARCELPTLSPASAASSNAAIAPAATAHGRALRVAAEYAVASAALREVEIELASTQRRLRAIEHHRLPVLQTQLHDLMLRLDELEREERLIARWAMRRGGGVPR